MYALFLVLNDLERLDEVMESLYALELGATAMDSLGMSAILHNSPLNPHKIENDIISNSTPQSKTLVSIINDEKKVDEAITQLNSLLKIDDEPGTAFLFVLPVLRTSGGVIDKDIL